MLRRWLKKILQTKNHADEALAELIIAIYGFLVKSEELKHVDKSIIKDMPLESDSNTSFYEKYKKLKDEFNEFKVHYKEIEYKLGKFKNSLMTENSTYTQSLKPKIKEENKFINLTVNNQLSYFPPKNSEINQKKYHKDEVNYA